MLLTDIIAEYKKIVVSLDEVESFYTLSKDLTSFYFNQYSAMTYNFYNTKQGSAKDALVSALNRFTQDAFDKVIVLNTVSRDLIQCIGSIKGLEIRTPILLNEVNQFILSATQADKEICNIMEAKLDGARIENMFVSLITKLNIFNLCYENIFNIEKHLNEFNNLLFEPLPDSISDDEYKDFCINSLVPSKEFEQITTSIENFSCVYDCVSRLLEVPVESRYYIRRIETGSLGITITCLVGLATAIAKFIDFCFKKYLSYKKAGLEIQSMRQALVKDDLEIVNELLKLNPNLENKQELIELACDSAFKYFKFNPRFKIDGKTYDADQEPSLLESKNNEEDDEK